MITTNRSQQLEAKIIELNQWRNEQVYDEIDDLGQQCIFLRWLMKEKVVNKKKIIKAHLCARGFEEEQNFRADSPTSSKEGLQLSCGISSNQWTLNSLDVKTAFLQGKTIERTVFVCPPKEANTNKIWKLRKYIYSLANASQYCYLKFREELTKRRANGAILCSNVLCSNVLVFYVLMF